MLDWNGNGRIDPVDVGISIAARGLNKEHEQEPELGDIRTTQKDSYIKNLWSKVLRTVKRDIKN